MGWMGVVGVLNQFDQKAVSVLVRGLFGEVGQASREVPAISMLEIDPNSISRPALDDGSDLFPHRSRSTSRSISRKTDEAEYDSRNVRRIGREITIVYPAAERDGGSAVGDSPQQEPPKSNWNWSNRAPSITTSSSAR